MHGTVQKEKEKDNERQCYSTTILQDYSTTVLQFSIILVVQYRIEVQNCNGIVPLVVYLTAARASRAPFSS